MYGENWGWIFLSQMNLFVFVCFSTFESICICLVSGLKAQSLQQWQFIYAHEDAVRKE